LKGSPYQILQENREWEALKDGNGRILPRRASISSYGFGGVNAHIVWKKYLTFVRKHSYTLGVKPQIMVFSAKNRERLNDVLRQKAWSTLQFKEELRLEDIAYTFSGREAMNSRVAMIVNNRKNLFHGMREYLKALEEKSDIEAKVPRFYRGFNEDQSEIRSLLSEKLEESYLMCCWVKIIWRSWLFIGFHVGIFYGIPCIKNTSPQNSLRLIPLKRRATDPLPAKQHPEQLVKNCLPEAMEKIQNIKAL
jgi:acyl transferase domain-containing protein